MDNNKEINDAISKKFGTSLDKLDIKQIHTLNQHNLYSPKQLSNKINKSYQSRAAKYDEAISDGHNQLEQSVMDGFGKDPKAIQLIHNAQQNKQVYNLWRKNMLKPINAHKSDALLHKDTKTLTFAPATSKQINSIKLGTQSIKVGVNPGNPMDIHSKNHKQYMRIRNDPKKLQAHRANVRAFDNTNSHRLGNKLYYIKKNMHKPHSKYYVGNNKNITPMEVLKNVKERKHNQHPTHKANIKSKHADINKRTLEHNQPKQEPSLDDVIKSHMESPQI